MFLAFIAFKYSNTKILKDLWLFSSFFFPNVNKHCFCWVKSLALPFLMKNKRRGVREKVRRNEDKGWGRSSFLRDPVLGKGVEVEKPASWSPAAPHVLGCSIVPFILQIRKLGLQEVNGVMLHHKAKFKKKKKSKLKLELTVSGACFSHGKCFQKGKAVLTDSGKKGPTDMN